MRRDGPERQSGTADAGVEVSAPHAKELLTAALTDWRGALVAQSGGSSLSDITLLGDANLDFSAAHPSGVAQLFTGRPTRLSNLVREGAALSTARRRARSVSVRADDYAQRFGIAPTFLAIGVASWTELVSEDAEEPDDDVSVLADATRHATTRAETETPAEGRGADGRESDGRESDGRDADGRDVAGDQDPGATGSDATGSHSADSGTTGSDATDSNATGSGTTGSGTTGSGTRAVGASSDAAAGAPRGDASGGAEAKSARGNEVRRTFRAPVLLRPVTLHPRGSGGADYELVLASSVEVNPILARALRTHGGLIDPVAIARGTFTGSGFDPRPALDRLAQLGRAVLDNFTLSESLVLGVFGHPGQVLVEDLDELSAGFDRHEVIGALAGDPRARSTLALPMPEPFFGDRDPGDERGVGDLDPAQQHALDVVATSAHLFLDAPPGADTTTTVAALVADAAATGRSVLYVPGHRRAAVALTSRLTNLGLDDLVLDVAPTAGWRTEVCRRLLGAMTLEQRPLDVTTITRRREQLVTRREQLRDYVEALHAPREPWGCSAYDALQGLARLTAPRPAPQTTVRLAPDVARALAGDRRAEVAGDLVRAAELGAFEIQPGSTPWYGADLDSTEAAEDVVVRLERLLEAGLPALQRRASQVADQTGLTPASSVAAWGEQLEMLSGVRASLDTFQPIVFERSAADFVAATASKEWRATHDIQMPAGHRRRLRKQAKDMVRPGRPVADLHSALVQIHRQREVWQAHCPAGGWPRLPESLSEIEAEYAAVRADVDFLEAVLATTPTGGGLASAPVEQLEERLRRLLANKSALETLPERTRLVRSLLAVGLNELLTDLATRRVGAHLVASELDLAWWTGVFEQIMRAEPSLAGFDGERLAALAAEYRELDLEHVGYLPEPVRAAVVGRVRGVLRSDRDQAELLFGELVEERMVSLRDTIERFGEIARSLRPVIAAAPMLVPHLLPASRTVDLLVIDAADHLDLEVVLPSIGRARQVVVVGDAKSASGSAVRSLSKVLPHVPLRVGDTRRDPYLTAFLAEHGYEGVLEPIPLPRSTPLVGFAVVDGTGMPDAESGAVVSTREEVDHVVELALTHAMTRPDESLAVVTVSPGHADRVRDALLSEMRDNPALAAFFDPGRKEPFVVTDLAGVAGLRRDAVILSVGYGRTPHGRVLHSLAPLTRAGGDALLLSALAATRHRLDVVTAFRGSDLDPERLRGPGSRLLAELLNFAEDRASGGGVPADPQFEVRDDDVADRLVLDLAERLWRSGLVVEVGHGLPGGMRIPLVVGHRELPDRFLVAVLTDDADYTGEPSVRVRDRQVVGRLERLGWVVSRVWSAAAFLDPQTEADAIARLVHEAADRALAAEPSRRAVVPTHVEPDDDAPEPNFDAASPAPATGSTAAIPAAFLADGAATPDAPASSDVPRRPVRKSTKSASAAPVQPAFEDIVAGGPSAASPGTGTPRPVFSPVSSPAVDASATPARPSTATPATATSATPSEVAASPVHGTRDVPAEASEPSPDAASEAPPRADRHGPRPPLARGLPIAAYGEDELEMLARWILSDDHPRDADDLAAELRTELGIAKRGARVDSVLRAVSRRTLA